MIKKLISNQIKKSGSFKYLEIENNKLKAQIKELTAINDGLIHEVKELKIGKEKKYSESENQFISEELRGISSDAGKPSVLKYILDNVRKNEKILDVGFGSGIYCKMLRAFNYEYIDGVDVYGENIAEMGLDKIYNNIYIENILDFDFKHYNLIIMGDVLEHIELDLAKKLLKKIVDEKKCNHLVVSIPYEYEQDEVYGNVYEKHLQPEVNKRYMEIHYPYLKLIDTAIMPHNGGIIATYVWNVFE